MSFQFSGPTLLKVMESSPKGLLTQVTQLWNLLDDLAESDPEGYGKFIQHQLKEGEKYCAAPEPQLCLQTKILKPEEKVLFINLGQWTRIPAPQSKAEPVPLSVGKPEDVSETSESYTVIDVAYNPDVLKAAKDDEMEMDQLIRLAMKCIEDRYQFTLSQSYHITNTRKKGSLQRMKNNFMGIETDSTDLSEKMKKELTLEQLRNSGINNQDDIPQLLLPKDHIPSKQRCLIEEISSSELQVGLKTPNYKLIVVKDQNGRSLRIEMEVELPGLSSVCDCDLSVSKDDLVIEVLEKYRLQVDLPEVVDTETTTAKFVTRKATLVITMPVLQ
ncbi:PIH1 domain-containing protein 2 isoform X1 [Dromiciops gliroides]|uniref:PIH1 domain-containing protein 2 isoform X1 n=2 Tax=Dromiciops gliroides TaxID=33562 RepID=UPI001CC4274A|nr:PIH1 domain-containing protein 2 isoform X1 [Dromiciops gliroides]